MGAAPHSYGPEGEGWEEMGGQVVQVNERKQPEELKVIHSVSCPTAESKFMSINALFCHKPVCELVMLHSMINRGGSVRNICRRFVTKVCLLTA